MKYRDGSSRPDGSGASEAPGQAGISRWLRQVPGTLWLVWLVYFLTVSGRVGNQDAEVTLTMSRVLLRGETTYAEKLAGSVRSADGRYTSQYGIGHSLYLVPYLGVGRGVAALVPKLSATMWEEFVVSFANVPVIGALMLYLVLAWRRAGANETRVGVGVLLFGLCTMLWPYSKWPFSDSLLALALFAAWYHWTGGNGTRATVWSGIWLSVALVSRRQADSVVPILCGLAVLDAWRRKEVVRLGWLTAAVLPGFGLRLWYNAVRFGGMFLERQRGFTGVDEVLKANPADRFLEVMFSQSYGFLPYNVIPLAVVVAGGWGLWKARRKDGIVAGVIVSGGIAFLSLIRFGSGVSFGSRYLLYTVGFMALAWPFVPWPKTWGARLIWVPLVAWSIWLMAGGVVMDPVPVMYRVREMRSAYLQWEGMSQEWGRVLGFRSGGDLPALEANPAWRHDPFRRPDFWWCHLWARFAKGGGLSDSGPVGEALKSAR